MADESSNRTFAAVIIDPGTQKLITQEGSLTIGDNTIEYYKKSTAVRMAFGLIGSMIEGRGKLLFSLQDEDISGYNYIEYRKKQMPTIYLKSGTAYTVSFAKPDQACPVLDAYMRQLFSRRESREMGNRTARVEQNTFRAEQRTARVEQNTFRAEPKTAGAENPAALRRAEEIYHQGERYYDGTKEIPKNPQKALECFLEAGRMGYSDGLFMAGIMLLNGDGVMPDEKRASNLLYAAAAKKNKFALKQIGFMYRNGKGVPQDYHKAMLYYREAVNAGLVDAWNNIGFLYMNGYGVSQDYRAAMDCYQKAAAAGNTASYNNIGYMYHMGLGVPVDYGKAMEYYRKSADAGRAEGMENIGELYRTGCGVKQDYEVAYDWYVAAARRGDQSAVEQIRKLVREGHISQQEASRWVY